jgi:hypothetical protein
VLGRKNFLPPNGMPFILPLIKSEDCGTPCLSFFAQATRKPRPDLVFNLIAIASLIFMVLDLEKKKQLSFIPCGICTVFILFALGINYYLKRL